MVSVTYPHIVAKKNANTFLCFPHPGNYQIGYIDLDLQPAGKETQGPRLATET